MHVAYEKIRPDSARSFHVAERELARFDAPWHFHPELELTLIVAGEGRRFVGDSLEPYEAGDLVLLGPNLPHFWQSNLDAGISHSVVVHFGADFLGAEAWLRPELQRVARLLARIPEGLHFPRSCRTHAHCVAQMKLLPATTGLPGLSLLLDLLDCLAQESAPRPLASRSYPPATDHRSEQRLARVFDFVGQNFMGPISLMDLAEQAAMSPAAFSRFFKRVTKRTPSDFLNDLRIEHACRLLRETDRTVADIAQSAGYVTLTNFNRRFRSRTGTTPRIYRRQFLPAG